MTFAKANKTEKFDDEYARLLCSVPGCGQLWSVKIDKPMCSFHQWNQPPKPTTNLEVVDWAHAAQGFDKAVAASRVWLKWRRCMTAL